jgi:hypothetical protein
LQASHTAADNQTSPERKNIHWKYKKSVCKCSRNKNETTAVLNYLPESAEHKQTTNKNKIKMRQCSAHYNDLPESAGAAAVLSAVR